MSTDKTMPHTLYSRDSPRTNPFDLNPVPGSAWDKDHLKWLGVGFTDELQAADMVPDGWVLRKSSKIYRSLTQYLDLPWLEIDSELFDRENSAVYDGLELLGKKRAFACDFLVDDSSSPWGQPSTSVEQTKRSPPIAESPQEHKTRRPRASDCLDPRPSVSDEEESSFTPPPFLLRPREALSSEGVHPATVLETTAVDMSLPSSPPLHDSRAPSTPPALPAHLLSSPNLPSQGSDPSYRPTSSPQTEPCRSDLSGSSQEDKAEQNVQAAALAFLYILQRAVKGAERKLEFRVR